MDFTFVGENGPERRIRVRFHYEAANKETGEMEQGGRALSNIGGKRIFTYCEISEKVGDEFRGLAGDCVVRNPMDQFNKSAGRRMALQRAMWQIKDRVLRKAIWNEYFNQHRDGWNMMIDDFIEEPATQEK
jgi:hypothetical protein